MRWMTNNCLRDHRPSSAQLVQGNFATVCWTQKFARVSLAAAQIEKWGWSSSISPARWMTMASVDHRWLHSWPKGVRSSWLKEVLRTFALARLSTINQKRRGTKFCYVGFRTTPKNQNSPHSLLQMKKSSKRTGPSRS